MLGGQGGAGECGLCEGPAGQQSTRLPREGFKEAGG